MLCAGSGVVQTSVPVVLDINPPAAPFAEQGTTCTSTLAPKQSCAVTIVFTPPSEGGFVGTVTIADDAVGNVQTVNLVGAGE
jgi:hypothetical protein